MDINIEVPKYFTCPISLQIMKDPVTTVSGITYDRENIEHWLFKTHNTLCPVTKHPLPIDSDLTPNHTLRRLIQAWCTANAIDPIPTPRPPLTKSHLINLIQSLYLPNSHLIETLGELKALAIENERNRAQMVEAGLVNALVWIIVLFCRNREMNALEECLCEDRNREMNALEDCLNLFYLVRSSLSGQINGPWIENMEIVDSLMWILGKDHVFRDNTVLKSNAAFALKFVIQNTNQGVIERLKPEFFVNIMICIKHDGLISHQGTNYLLHVLLHACSSGRNRVMMVESGAVFDLIELELLKNTETKTTELVLGILYHLCSCAEGRAQLVGHAAGIAVVTRRILMCSLTADDRAVLIVRLISKYSGTDGVVQEMLRVGTVAKLCMVMQANCAAHLKEKAREILRMHFDVWKDSPCIELDTLTRYTR